jgi:hypothetical protein
VWNSYPLSVGGTPLQVYIDRKVTLNWEKAAETLSRSNITLNSEIPPQRPQMRKTIVSQEKEEFCHWLEKFEQTIIITRISKSYLELLVTSFQDSNLTMVIQSGEIVCLDTY